jgi:TolB-like protein/tetratricopeptide (TPR) repeat protein/predicted Ser/Thr protein kinase
MALEAGARLGPYEIVGLLGSGGMGEVYRARDPRLEREVAIKVLPEEIADAKRLRRFEQEARTAGALNHPSVLAVYDVGAHQGVPYVVSELLEGHTLRVRLEGGALPLRKALDHALEIAHGLAAAHDRGIVHRDLKPDNVFITEDGRAKILDFGLAKLTRPRLPVQEGDQGTATKATESGVVLGTVGFMSPEQVRGEEVDPRSDIFSFGAVLYEMLSGVRAFRRDSAVETMNAILKEDPPELSETGRGIPPGLVRIVRRCLEKRAGDRFRSAHDLALGLEAVSSGVSGPSHQEEESRSGVARAGGLIWRHKRRLVLALAATALVTAGVYRGLVRSPAPAAGTHGIDSLAVLPFENVGAEPGSQYLSDGVAESLIDELSRVPKLRVIARSTSFRFRGNDVDPRQVGRDLGVGAVLTGRVSLRGDTLVIGAELVDVAKGTQLWGERYNTKMGDIFVVQEDIASQISRGLRLRLAPPDQGLLTKRQTGSPEAYRLHLLGRYELTMGTVEGFKKAIQYAQQATEKEPGYAAAYETLALALAGYTKMGEMPYREGYSRSRTAATKALELDERLPEAHLVLSWDVLSLDWDWAGAEREMKRALELNPSLAEAQSKYGFYLVLMGRRSKEGIEYLERALALDPASLVCRVGLLYGYYLDRQYDQALARAKKMPELNSFAWAHGLLALVYREKGMYEEAIAEDRKASPRCSGHRGNTYARAGKVSEARGCLREIRERFEKEGVGAYDMALVYAGLGEKDQAFEWLERAYEVHDQGITALKVDPPLDPLRSDPRFQDLLRRLKFPS